MNQATNRKHANASTRTDERLRTLAWRSPMKRGSLFTASLACLVLMMGCSSPSESQSEDETNSVGSALVAVDCAIVEAPEDCDGEGAPAFKMNSVASLTSLEGTSVSGTNANGQTITAIFATTTTFKAANLNKFQPGDPILPSVLAYNTAVTNGENLLGAIEGLVAFGGKARISVVSGTTTIKSFRPVP